MRYKIINKKKWKETEGYPPSRIVLLELYDTTGLIREYSTHQQISDTADISGTKHLSMGHYFREFEDAKRDFDKRRIESERDR